MAVGMALSPGDILAIQTEDVAIANWQAEIIDFHAYGFGRLERPTTEQRDMQLSTPFRADASDEWVVERAVRVHVWVGFPGRDVGVMPHRLPRIDLGRPWVSNDGR